MAKGGRGRWQMPLMLERGEILVSLSFSKLNRDQSCGRLNTYTYRVSDFSQGGRSAGFQKVALRYAPSAGVNIEV